MSERVVELDIERDQEQRTFNSFPQANLRNFFIDPVLINGAPTRSVITAHLAE